MRIRIAVFDGVRGVWVLAHHIDKPPYLGDVVEDGPLEVNGQRGR